MSVLDSFRPGIRAPTPHAPTTTGGRSRPLGPWPGDRPQDVAQDIASDADVDRLRGRARGDQVSQQGRQLPGREDRVASCEQLVERPPAHLDDVLRGEVEPRRGLEARVADEVDPLRLPAPLLTHLREPVLAPPDARAELVVVETELLRE